MSEPIVELKERLKKAMLVRDIRPIELSEKTGIPKSAISQYMSGYAKPKQDRLYKICKVLDVNEAWLLGFDVSMDRTIESINFDDKIVNTTVNNSLNKISNNNPDLSEDELKMVNTFVKALKSKKHMSLVELFLNAAHEIDGASEEDKQKDDDIMNDEDFWK